MPAHILQVFFSKFSLFVDTRAQNGAKTRSFARIFKRFYAFAAC